MSSVKTFAAINPATGVPLEPEYTDASPQEIEALVAQSQKRSAVFDVITNPTNVAVTVNS